MKRDNRFNYGHAVHQQAIIDGSVEPVIDEKELEKVCPTNAQDAFLKLVYAPDPVTLMPTGDLAYMVSDKANPEVKNWVLQNIMIDVSSAAMPAAPKGLSDDDIAALARDPKESVQSYMERVNTYAKSNAELYERLASMVKQSNGKPSESVPVEPVSSSVSSE